MRRKVLAIAAHALVPSACELRAEIALGSSVPHETVASVAAVPSTDGRPSGDSKEDASLPS